MSLTTLGICAPGRRTRGRRAGIRLASVVPPPGVMTPPRATGCEGGGGTHLARLLGRALGHARLQLGLGPGDLAFPGPRGEGLPGEVLTPPRAPREVLLHPPHARRDGPLPLQHRLGAPLEARLASPEVRRRCQRPGRAGWATSNEPGTPRGRGPRRSTRRCTRRPASGGGAGAARPTGRRPRPPPGTGPPSPPGPPSLWRALGRPLLPSPPLPSHTPAGRWARAPCSFWRRPTLHTVLGRRGRTAGHVHRGPRGC